MRVRLISLVVVFIAWWVASQIAGDFILPGPVDVVGRFVQLLGGGQLAPALAVSLYALAVGGLLAVVIGVPLGILLGVQRLLGNAFDFYFSALYVMPFSAVAPLFVLWFGIDAGARMIFVFAFTLPQIVIVCYQGARNTPTNFIEVARSYRATSWEIFRKTIMPYEVPFIFTALRLGVGRAVQGMVVAELLISAAQGLGFLIKIYSAAFDIGAVLAIVLFIMMVGIVASALVQRVEGAIAPWRKGVGVTEDTGNA